MLSHKTLSRALLTLTLLTPLASTPTLQAKSNAAPTVRRQFEVTHAGGTAAVKTSADKDAVIVSIVRSGQATHHYRAYPQVATITVQIDRRKLFTYHINTGRIEAERFSLNIHQGSGTERRQRTEVAAIRGQLIEDMNILRAVRGFDKRADVLLAELAYVVLTYDDSIMDGEPPAGFAVSEREAAASGRAAGAVSFVSVSARGRQSDSLDGCLDTCSTHYNECQADQGVTNKTTCHNNRTSCTNTCYGTYGGKKRPPILP